jgi:hypothetical protein
VKDETESSGEAKVQSDKTPNKLGKSLQLEDKMPCESGNWSRAKLGINRRSRPLRGKAFFRSAMITSFSSGSESSTDGTTSERNMVGYSTASQEDQCDIRADRYNLRH